MVSLEELEKTTDALISARRVLAEAKEQVIEAKTDLDNAITSLYAGGKVTGDNEKARDRCIRYDTIDERIALESAEKRERAATLELEICKDLRRHLENLISVELCKEEA